MATKSKEKPRRTGDNSIRALMRETAQGIERIESEISDLNKDKAGLYDGLRDVGVDVDAFRSVMRRRQKPRDEITERDAKIEEYERILFGDGTKAATRARARDAADEEDGDE